MLDSLGQVHREHGDAPTALQQLPCVHSQHPTAAHSDEVKPWPSQAASPLSTGVQQGSPCSTHEQVLLSQALAEQSQ